MKQFCTLPAGIVFLMTTGIPLLAFIVFLAVDFFTELGPRSSVEPVAGYALLFLLSIWLTGTILLQIWGLSTSIQLSKKLTDRTALNRSALFLGIFGLTTQLTFIYALVDAFWIKNISVDQSISSYSWLSSRQIIYLIPVLFIAIWDFPRMLFFGFLAKKLTLIERESGWFPTMILFVLWPVGVWFLQPRIKAIVAGKKAIGISDHLIGEN